MTHPAVDILLPSHLDAVGESPVWSDVEQALYWVDIEAPALRRWSMADGKFTSWTAPERIACIALHEAGGFIAGMETGVFHVRVGDAGRLDCTLLAAVQHPEESMRFNDGRCDRQGRFWAGTMVRNMALARAAGGLYRMDATGLSSPVVQGLATQNGLAFSPDGCTMFLSDSHPTVQKIWTLPLHDDGTVGERSLFVDMKDLPGRPDGAAIDAEGCYWICGNDAGLVHRFTPDGRLDRSIRVPGSKPSMCSFGGPDLDTLFITSIRPAQPAGDDVAHGGAVFVIRPGVCGLPETPFSSTT